MPRLPPWVNPDVAVAVDQAFADGADVVIEAPGGWGVKELVDDTLERNAFMEARKVHRWSSRATRAWIDARDEIDDCGPALVTANRIPSVLKRHLSQRQRLTITTADLRLPQDHVARELLAAASGRRPRHPGDAEPSASPNNETHAAAVARVVDGWPHLLRSVLEELTAGDIDEVAVNPQPLIHAAVEPIVHRLDESQQFWLSQLAALDDLTPADTEVHGPLFWNELIEAHVPLYRRIDGQWALVAAVRDWIRRSHRTDTDALAQIATLRFSQGRQLAAVSLLARIGRGALAAQMLAEIAPEAVEMEPPSELIRLSGLLAPHAEAHPRILLIGASAHGSLEQTTEQRNLLERAGAISEGSDHDRVRREAVAELVLHRLLYVDDQLEAWTIVRDLDREPDGAIRAIGYETAANLTAARHDDESADEAIKAFENATDLWLGNGRPTRAAYAMRAMAARVLMPLGRLREAQAALERALDMTPVLGTAQATTTAQLTVVRALRGEPISDNEFGAVRDSLVRLGSSWRWTLWDRAAALSHIRNGRLDAAQHAADSAFATLYDFPTHPLRSVLHAEFAEHYAWFGHVALAEGHLAAARLEGTDPDENLQDATLVLAMARGDRAEMRAVTEAARRRPRHFGWKPLLCEELLNEDGPNLARPDLHSIAHGAGVEAFVTAVVAARNEHRGEQPTAPAPADAPLHVTASRPVTTASPDNTDDSLRVELLGEFAIVNNGVRTRPKPSKALEAVQAIALYGGSIPSDVLVGWLWPDDDGEAGRKRLKNVIARAQALVAGSIQRNRGRVSFDARITTDLLEFQAAARRASQLFAEGDTEAIAAARVALETYKGELLPERPFHDGIAVARRHVSVQALALLNQLVRHATDERLAPFIVDRWQAIDALDYETTHLLTQWLQERDLTQEAERVARSYELALA